MNYQEINVNEVLESVASAVEQGNYRKATKKRIYGSTPCRLKCYSPGNASHSQK